MRTFKKECGELVSTFNDVEDKTLKANNRFETLRNMKQPDQVKYLASLSKEEQDNILSVGILKSVLPQEKIQAAINRHALKVTEVEE